MFELMLCSSDSFSLHFPALRRVRRHLSLHRYEIPDPHEVISRYRKLEYPPDLGSTSVAQLPEQPHGLQPPKDLLYSLPFPLADCVPGVPRRSLIYRRPSPTVVLRNMRRHICLANLFDKRSCIVSLVAPHRHSAPAAYFAREHNTCIALCRPSRSRGAGPQRSRPGWVRTAHSGGRRRPP